MIARDEYLKHLIAFKDKPVVKVITGIRRCGKSTLLMLYDDWLKKNGVASKQIISINLESARYDNVKDYKYYVLLDEVQNVAEFERAVESLSIDHNVDIYITGSNAYMLSSELATLLSGRYVEVAMLPLSFAEYQSAWPNENPDQLFLQYMKYGGFPFLAGIKDENVSAEDGAVGHRQCGVTGIHCKKPSCRRTSGEQRDGGTLLGDVL